MVHSWPLTTVGQLLGLAAAAHPFAASIIVVIAALAVMRWWHSNKS